MDSGTRPAMYNDYFSFVPDGMFGCCDPPTNEAPASEQRFIFDLICDRGLTPASAALVDFSNQENALSPRWHPSEILLDFTSPSIAHASPISEQHGSDQSSQCSLATTTIASPIALSQTNAKVSCDEGVDRPTNLGNLELERLERNTTGESGLDRSTNSYAPRHINQLPLRVWRRREQNRQAQRRYRAHKEMQIRQASEQSQLFQAQLQSLLDQTKAQEDIIRRLNAELIALQTR